ncbi:MAG TPA: L-lactate permease [Gemmataceae bacterium]|nr:L-lactate permease [Gemmataceae bacterium]
MFVPAVYVQNLDPLGQPLLSTALAALPVLVLFCVLVPLHRPAPLAAFLGAVTAMLVAWLAYGMALPQAGLAFLHGAGFGLLPVGWTIFNAMLIYNVTVEAGQFAIVRRSVAGLSPDARIQAILVGFSFGAFLEGAAGGGTPVAICGAILVGLGFDPFKAAVLCLIANTSPVAYGGLGTPLITLSGVTDLPTETLSIMAGHQLPLLSCIVPVWMVRCMCPWRQTLEVWPALAVAGGSFAAFQFVFATIHAYVPDLVLYPMTDVGGGIFSLLVMAGFLRFWQPRTTVEYAPPAHHVEADKLAAPLTALTVCRAWAPFALMSVFLMGSGLVRQRETKGPVHVGSVPTSYKLEIPGLHREVARAERLRKVPSEMETERAEFEVAWVTAPGSPVLAAALVSMILLRMNAVQVGRVFRQTVRQMRIPIPTIAFMLGLSYVTRYAGMDATLGVAFAATGALYPFFAAILGWLGVFLTGTDAGSNALFGSLQKITATEIYKSGVLSQMTLVQSQILICTANSTGGVMGKMIDAQSICVATAATDQVGKEAAIFKAVLWHSIILASLVGFLTLAQAYVPTLTRMVPK